MRGCFVLAIVLLGAPLHALAQEVEPAPPAAGAPLEKASPPADVPTEKVPPSLDFDLMEPSSGSRDAAARAAAEAEAERIDHLVKERRSMLKLHQELGLATLAGLAGTTVVGQLEFNDKYRGGGDTGRWLPLHVALLSVTSALFTTVGLLGVLAPVPYPKHFRLDTANIHKLFMGLATLGMVTQLVLGLVTHGSEGHLYQVQLATAHQVIGYATLGAMTAGTITLFF